MARLTSINYNLACLLSLLNCSGFHFEFMLQCQASFCIGQPYYCFDCLRCDCGRPRFLTHYSNELTSARREIPCPIACFHSCNPRLSACQVTVKSYCRRCHLGRAGWWRSKGVASCPPSESGRARVEWFCTGCAWVPRLPCRWASLRTDFRLKCLLLLHPCCCGVRACAITTCFLF